MSKDGTGASQYSKVLQTPPTHLMTRPTSLGSLLSFLVDSKPAFEIPLSEVSRVSSGKHEVALEFHQGDSAPVSLVEMRFHIPSTGIEGEDDPVQVRAN